MISSLFFLDTVNLDKLTNAMQSRDDGRSKNGGGWLTTKGGFKAEETGGFLLLQNKYSKSLS